MGYRAARKLCKQSSRDTFRRHGRRKSGLRLVCDWRVSNSWALGKRFVSRREKRGTNPLWSASHETLKTSAREYPSLFPFSPGRAMPLFGTAIISEHSLPYESWSSTNHSERLISTHSNVTTTALAGNSSGTNFQPSSSSLGSGYLRSPLIG
jgi:hypothetical protein